MQFHLKVGIGLALGVVFRDVTEKFPSTSLVGCFFGEKS